VIVRGARPVDNFAQIHNAALADGRLSFKARGVLAYLLSRPPGWQTSRERLAQSGIDGERAVRTAIKELETFGYMTRTRSHNPDGTFSHTQTVTDQPVIPQPTVGTKQPDGEEPPPDDVTVGTLCAGGYGSNINNTDLITLTQEGGVVNSPTVGDPQPHHGELQAPRDAEGWRPSAAALKTADKVVEILDIEINIAKYRTRMHEMKKTPSSAEWLKWILADEQEAKIKAKAFAAEARQSKRWDSVAD